MTRLPCHVHGAPAHAFGRQFLAYDLSELPEFFVSARTPMKSDADGASSSSSHHLPGCKAAVLAARLYNYGMERDALLSETVRTGVRVVHFSLRIGGCRERSLQGLLGNEAHVTVNTAKSPAVPVAAPRTPQPQPPLPPPPTTKNRVQTRCGCCRLAPCAIATTPWLTPRRASSRAPRTLHQGVHVLQR